MFLENPFLTEADCMTILRKNNKRKDPIIDSMSIKSLSGNEGFSGQHLILTINYQDDPQSTKTTERFFLKVLNNSYPILFKMCTSIKAYDKEEFFYTELIKGMESYGIETTFAPKGVFCKPYVLVLEDLSIHGYKNSPKQDLFDVELCRLGLKCLAEFHASVICYQEMSKCDIFGKYEDYLGEIFLTDQDNLGKDWFDTTMDGLCELIKLVPEEDGITSEMFIGKLREGIKQSKELVSPKNQTYKHCVLHRDLWSNNFLIRYQNGKPLNCVLVDYQSLSYGPLALDPVQMLTINLRRNVRDANFYPLIEFYYDTFSTTLSRYGVKADSVITLKDFVRSCDEMRIPAKLHATGGHTFTFLTDSDLAFAFQSDASTENFLFGDKRDSVRKSFQDNDLYREILLEDLVELRDLLFSK